MRIEELLTAPRSPWQNVYVERLIGSVRRECLDHVIVCNRHGLRRVLNAYVEYYLRSRTHLALDKDTPCHAPSLHPPMAPSGRFPSWVASTTASPHAHLTPGLTARRGRFGRTGRPRRAPPTCSRRGRSRARRAAGVHSAAPPARPTGGRRRTTPPRHAGSSGARRRPSLNPPASAPRPRSGRCPRTCCTRAASSARPPRRLWPSSRGPCGASATACRMPLWSACCAART